MKRLFVACRDSSEQGALQLVVICLAHVASAFLTRSVSAGYSMQRITPMQSRCVRSGERFKCACGITLFVRDGRPETHVREAGAIRQESAVRHLQLGLCQMAGVEMYTYLLGATGGRMERRQR